MPKKKSEEKEVEQRYEGILLVGPRRVYPKAGTEFVAYVAVMAPLTAPGDPSDVIASAIDQVIREARDSKEIINSALEIQHIVEGTVQPKGTVVYLTTPRVRSTTLISGEFYKDWDAKLEVYQMIQLQEVVG